MLVNRLTVLFLSDQFSISRIFLDNRSKMLVHNYFYGIILLSLSAGVVFGDIDCANKEENGNCPKKRLKRYLGFKQGARTFVSGFGGASEKMFLTTMSLSNSSESTSRTTCWKWIRSGPMPTDSGRTLTSPILCPNSTKFAGEMCMTRWNWCWTSKDQDQVQYWKDQFYLCLLFSHGFDGRACVLRAFCDASRMVTPRSGIFFKLFRLVFSWVDYMIFKWVK